MNKLIRFIKKPAVAAAMFTLILIALLFLLSKGMDIFRNSFGEKPFMILEGLIAILVLYVFFYINFKGNNHGK